MVASWINSDDILMYESETFLWALIILSDFAVASFKNNENYYY